MSSCETRFARLLDPFADAALPQAERDRVEAHLEVCAACRAEAAGLLKLREQAHALPSQIEPPRDLWPDIEARIRRQVVPLPIRAAEAPPARAAAGRPRWPAWLAAAAAVALVVLSTGLGAYWLGARQAAPLATLPAESTERTEPRAATALAAWEPAEQQYRGVVERLATELDARRGALAPETVAAIEENLEIIDRAIAESRAALEADPANVRLPLMLSEIYRTKVELLQHAVQLQRAS